MTVWVTIHFHCISQSQWKWIVTGAISSFWMWLCFRNYSQIKFISWHYHNWSGDFFWKKISFSILYLIACFPSDFCISPRWETLRLVTLLKSRRHGETWASALRNTAWPIRWICTCGPGRPVPSHLLLTHNTSSVYSCCLCWDSSSWCSALLCGNDPRTSS